VSPTEETAMCRRFLLVLAVTLSAGSLVRSAAAASVPPETRCQRDRHKVAGDYAACQSNVMDGGFAYPKALKCVSKHNASWPKLQAKYPTTSCATPRLVDNTDGTVTDNLTRLVWVKKTPGDPLHDPELSYRLSANNDYDADGTAFTTFLAALNAPACFAGHCDWRLPTFTELQTLLLVTSDCPLPCIDAVFGAGTDLVYWSSSTQYLTSDAATAAWFVAFGNGGMGGNDKKTLHPVFAVRGGW
jgi:hypothetical protein